MGKGSFEGLSFRMNSICWSAVCVIRLNSRLIIGSS